MASGAPDQRFAEYVVQSKIVTPAQVEEARRSQAAAASIGIEIGLAEALMRMQALTPSQRAVIEQRIGTAQATGGIHQLGPYRLLRRLGAGSMGVVYLAEDTMAQRQVALKVLARELASDPAFLQRFHQEAVASGKLNHANLIAAFNFGEDRGWCYYVMEYCPGESTEQFLERRGPMAWGQALRLTRDVAQGLHYAHQQRIIHRDVKPGNIMMTPEGVGRLLDMGLSKHLFQPEEGAGRTVGTPHYISPEQARGQQAVDGRTDIYSLGATLFHLLTGRPPFAGSDGVEVMRQHVSAPVPDPATYRADIPERVRRIVQRMMAKDPGQRYTDCAELIADLDLLLAAEEPTSALAAKPSSHRPPKGPAPLHHRQGAHPPSVWGGDEASAADGQPAPAWGGSAPASTRPAARHAAGATAEPERPVRSRYGSELDVQVPRPRMRRNTWLLPAIGAGAVLALIGLPLLFMNSGGNATKNPGTPKTNLTPPPPVLDRQPPEVPKMPNPAITDTTAQTPEKTPDVPALPPTANIENEERWKDAIDLLQLVDLTADPIQGLWRFDEEHLSNDRTPRARLSLPYRVPEEYDFRVDFTRRKGDEVAQIVNWKGTGVAWVMGALSNTECGFLRSNTDLTPHYADQAGSGIGNDKRHSGIVEVRKDRIRGYLDGKLITEWTGAGKDLTWHPGWDLPGTALLGLGSHNAGLQIHAIRVREVSGQGRLLRKPSPLFGPGGVSAEWKSALAQLPPEAQLKHINVKLQQVNPGFTGRVTMWVDGGRLTSINLQGASLGDLSPLAGLPYLSGLNLGGTEEAPSPVVDLSACRALSVQYLDCSYSQVSNLAPLNGMKLRQLICHHTGVADLQPLQGMPLESVVCGSTRIQSLKPLADAPLKELDCSGTGVRDLSPLAGSALTELDISGTQVSSLEPLKGLPLVKLRLHTTPVNELSVLAGMPLRELNIGETKVSDFSPLRSLKLTTLSLDGLGVKDVSFLSGMPLSSLNLNGNGLTDLAFLQGFPLTELQIAFNPVSDLSPLKAKALRSLSLRGTKAASLEVLHGMPLRTLDIRDVTPANIEFLKGFPLKVLFLDYDPRNHAEVLKSIKTLNRVNTYSLSTFLEMKHKPPGAGK